jgi:hypothetical protein
MNHPQGRCPEPRENLHMVGDHARMVYRLCAECRAIYEGPQFGFVFLPADSPEWVQRAAEKRLPAKVAA